MSNESNEITEQQQISVFRTSLFTKIYATNLQLSKTDIADKRYREKRTRDRIYSLVEMAFAVNIIELTPKKQIKKYL